MRLCRQICNQVYQSEELTFEVEITTYFGGSFFFVTMEDFAYYVGFKDVPFTLARWNMGVLSRVFKHMLDHPERTLRIVPDIIDKCNGTEKVSETYYLQYYLKLINQISSEFIIEGTADYFVTVSLKNYKGIKEVTTGRIVADTYEDFVENCEKYCTGLTELAEMLSA